MSKSIPEQLKEIDETIDALKRTGSHSALKPFYELRAKLQGDFKDESGGENLIINLDLDPSRVCYLENKVKLLEAELKKIKSENEEMRKILGANVQS